MNIKISDHFDYKRLLKYAIYPISMMLFCSIYSVVDGIFIANYVGKNPLAAINIVWPIIMIIGSFGFMLGSGGSAEISKCYGEGNQQLANQYFSNIIFTVITVGVVLSFIAFLQLEKLLYLCGATKLLIDDCLRYGRILLVFTPLFLLQNAFQTLSSTAEKPNVGFISTFIAGISNIVFDYLFIAVFQMGVVGAALGTISGYILGNIYPIYYFASKNDSLYQIRFCPIHLKMIFKSCYNGVSEMISNISGSIVCITFNIWLMKIIGEDGVAAYSAMMYLDFLFKAIIIGYLVGFAPIIAYNYGSQNHQELHNVFKKSIVIIITTTIIMFLFAQFGNQWISSLFDKGDVQLRAILTNGFRIYSYSYLFCGISLLTSSLFTALCNGFLSAVISFARALVLPIILINYLAVVLQLQGVWLTMPLTELITFLISLFLLILMQKKYQY